MSYHAFGQIMPHACTMGFQWDWKELTCVPSKISRPGFDQCKPGSHFNYSLALCVPDEPCPRDTYYDQELQTCVLELPEVIITPGERPPSERPPSPSPPPSNGGVVAPPDDPILVPALPPLPLPPPTQASNDSSNLLVGGAIALVGVIALFAYTR